MRTSPSSSTPDRTAALVVLVACLWLAPARSFPAAEGFLEDEERTNGEATLRATDGFRSRALASAVSLGPEAGKKVLAGTIVAPDGYVLTKAAETHSMKAIRVFLPGDVTVDARLVKRDEKLDLALLKIERGGLTAVSWGASRRIQAGQWLSSLADHGASLRLGVFSAHRRPIPNSGAVMGVRFARSDKGDVGVQIEEVATDGPAEQSGLKADDVLLELNGSKVNDAAAVKRVIAGLQPGDLVKVKYQREGRDRECEVKLASKNRVMLNWGGEDFGNHGTSSRTDNYPEIIQHDMPLGPSDMGGAVFDLQGRAVGLNIARVDRVTNYALPVEVFLPQVIQWMKEDREKKKP